MGTEKTIIKDLKGSGGIVGITNQKAALVRWTLTRHFLTSFSSAMNDRAGITSTSNTSHEEMKQTALKRDALQIFYDGFFSAHIAPNTIEAAGCLSNGKLTFFKS
jgi:hypothetical protein